MTPRHRHRAAVVPRRRVHLRAPVRHSRRGNRRGGPAEGNPATTRLDRRVVMSSTIRSGKLADGGKEREPANLREWRSTKGRLFSCGRPGRATLGRKRVAVDVETIDHWVNGLP